LSALNDHIILIQSKLQQLLKQYELLQKQQQEDKVSIQKLEAALKEKETAAEQLLEQNLLLKASVTEMDPTDKKLLEQKIQLYIKNIDQCISQLSQ
jgi:uncharacterized membrane protein